VVAALAPVTGRPLTADGVATSRGDAVAVPAYRPRVPERSVAVLLNRNAQAVGPRVLAWFRTRLPPASLHVVATLDESRAALARVLADGFGALCVGGGDGSFQQVVADLIALTPEPAPRPVLMPLRLGTGNAIADVAGASDGRAIGLARDLARAASDEPGRALGLLEVEGRITHFTGVGLDADWAGDYTWLIKQRLGRGRLLPLVRGLPGYLMTAFGLTLPRLLVRPRRPIRIVALADVRRLDLRGRTTATIADGDVVHAGEVSVAAASTVVPYSAGLPFFPFADDLEGAFQLRASDLGLGGVLARLPRARSGAFDDPKHVWDFAARAVRFEFAEPTQWHVGGDVQPPVTSLTVRSSPSTVQLLRRS